MVRCTGFWGKSLHGYLAAYGSALLHETWGLYQLLAHNARVRWRAYSSATGVPIAISILGGENAYACLVLGAGWDGQRLGVNDHLACRDLGIGHDLGGGAGRAGWRLDTKTGRLQADNNRACAAL